MAPQRAVVRRPCRTQQSRDCGQARHGQSDGVAPLLRHPAAASGQVVAVLAWQRSALRAPVCGRNPVHGEPQGHGRPVPPVLERGAGAHDPLGQACGHRCARELATRTRQTPRQHLRREHHPPQYSDRCAARVHPRREPQAHPQPACHRPALGPLPRRH
eukprot:Amastigsp_a689086_53.p2 type:complete len:159 gc:universal Amastigsp_a689086_53:346-822(+)